MVQKYEIVKVIKIKKSDCKKYFPVNNVFVGLISNSVFRDDNGSKKYSIVCFNAKGIIKWVLGSVSQAEFWQDNDSFIDVTENFYVRPEDQECPDGKSEFYTKLGKVRCVTFQGFSYEVDVENGSAEYFDFHK